MWYKIDSEKIEFESVEYRNFLLDFLVNSGFFPTDNLNFLLQKQKENNFINDIDIKKLTEFFSRYEKQIDHAWKNKDPNFAKKSDTERWGQFWLDTLSDMHRELQILISVGADLESLNLHIGSRVKSLVIEVAKDSKKYQRSRYIKNEPLNFLQKIAWKIRTLKLEWRWGKRRKLYGDFEKFDTEKEHSSSKSVMIICGYCGFKVSDSWKHPKKILTLEPQCFQIKHEEILTLTSETTVAKYDDRFSCDHCKSNLRYAHINKIARAVSVVLL